MNGPRASFSGEGGLLRVSNGDPRRIFESFLAGEDDDRSSLARELHDELGQTLAALELGLSQLDPDKPRETARRVHALKRAVREANLELRRVLEGLQPLALEALGLAAALERLARARAEVTDVSIRLSVCELPQLPFALEFVVYRVVQAALGNSLRHAHASEVAISVEVSGSQLSATVVDDGVGFLVGECGVRGLGLSGMHARVEALGGRLRVVSSPGAGTRVDVELHLEPRAR